MGCWHASLRIRMADHLEAEALIQVYVGAPEAQKHKPGGCDKQVVNNSAAPVHRVDRKPRRKSKGCSVVELFDPATNVSTVQVFPPRKKKKGVVQVYDPATDTTTTQVCHRLCSVHIILG